MPNLDAPPYATPVDTAGVKLSTAWMKWFNLLRGAVNKSYGAFHDTTNQPIALANSPQTLTINTTDLSSGVSVKTPTSRVYVNNAGIYNVQFSLQLVSSNASIEYAFIWLRVNGVNVPASAGQVSIQGSGTSLIAGWNYVMSLNAGDYFELVIDCTSDKLTVSTLAAQTSPYPRPASPSIILTVTQVM